jgi:tryptophan-rich sensory protein
MAKKINIVKLIVSIVIAQLAGIIGSLFTITSSNSWYANLIKPSFNPPNWIFGPVWTLLYLLMGVSLYLIWVSKNSRNRKIGLYLFFTQLVLNSLWSILFFGLQNPLFAFIEIIILWLAILLTIIYFYKVNKKAAYLLIPYILWVTFATILNFSIFILN